MNSNLSNCKTLTIFLMNLYPNLSSANKAHNKMMALALPASTRWNKNFLPPKKLLMIFNKILLMLVIRKQAFLKKKREKNKGELKMAAVVTKRKKMRGNQKLL